MERRPTTSQKSTLFSSFPYPRVNSTHLTCQNQRANIPLKATFPSRTSPKRTAAIHSTSTWRLLRARPQRGVSELAINVASPSLTTTQRLRACHQDSRRRLRTKPQSAAANSPLTSTRRLLNSPYQPDVSVLVNNGSTSALTLITIFAEHHE